MKKPVIVEGLRNSVASGAVRALILLIGLIAVLAVINLGQTSQATVTGQRVHDLQEQLDRARRENAQMEYDLAVLTTPARIAERARLLGLRPATSSQIVYIVVKGYTVSSPGPAPVKSERSGASPGSQPFLVSLWQELRVRIGLGPGAATAGTAADP